MSRDSNDHWPEYLSEALLLGLFMISASTFCVLLEHPASPLRAQLEDPLLRRALMGLAMGGTAIALIYSRLGKRSGAHMNPAVTLTFVGLGRVKPRDAAFYVAAQVAGGLLGMAVASLLLRPWIGDPSVGYVATRPGPSGAALAFAAELVISFVLMSAVLWCSSNPRTEPRTGLLAGGLVALYITFEAPLSGMSMNFARTLGSAVAARELGDLWVYALAPAAGMFAAAALHRWHRDGASHGCAKLNHSNDERCIFCGAPGKDTHR